MDLNKFVILIPGVNEEKVIGSVIEQLQAKGFKNILVVNDGSTDNTGTIAYNLGAVVLTHAINVGYGGATITGFKFIMQSGLFQNCTYVITVDGDGQHNINDVVKVANKIDEGYDFIIGKRIMTPQNSPLVKIILNFFADLLAFLITGKYVRGIYSGLKAIRIDKLRNMNLSLKDYSFSAEYSIEAIKSGLKFSTYDIEAIYTNYSKTKSYNLHISKTLKFAKDILK